MKRNSTTSTEGDRSISRRHAITTILSGFFVSGIGVASSSHSTSSLPVRSSAAAAAAAAAGTAAESERPLPVELVALESESGSVPRGRLIDTLARRGGASDAVGGGGVAPFALPPVPAHTKRIFLARHGKVWYH